MVFQALDKWMLDIELKRNPTPRERRQHVKLERIRSEIYERYLKGFKASLNSINERPMPMHCKERAMRPIERLGLSLWDAYKNTLGG